MNVNLKNEKKINNPQTFFSFIDYKEYYLMKNSIIYKISIFVNKNEIIINCKNYMITLNLNNTKNIIDIKFNSINDLYKFLYDNFDDNKVQINNIKKNEKLELIMNIELNNNKIDNKIILLKYNKYNNNYILNKINQLENEVNNLKTILKDLQIENKKTIKEIELLKKSHNKKEIKNLYLLSNITNDSNADFDLDKTFTIFKSIDNIFYLIYSNSNKLIISYNLEKQQKITSIKSNHNESISNFRHYLDQINKRDLVLSISAKDNNLKLWQINNWECLLNLNNVNKVGYLDSACFLYDNNMNYIITSNSNKNDISEQIKIFDFQGNKIREIAQSNEQTYFIDVYYEYNNNINNIYIITGNKDCIRTFNYKKNKLYKKYYDYNNGAHICVIIYNFHKELKLIESCDDGIIRIWDFHSGKLLKKIKISTQFLFGICLWNSNYIYVGCEDKTIKLIEINKGLVVKNLLGHNDDVLSLNKIILPKYGECLISQGRKNDQIKLWVKNN